MVREQTTPEDKLLRLIETPQKIKASFFGKRLVDKKKTLPNFWDRLKTQKEIYSLDNLSRLLVGLAVILTIFLVAQFFISSRDWARLNLGNIKVAGKEIKTNRAILLPLDNYLEGFSKTSMFSGVSESTAREAEVKEEEDLSAQVKDLKLVGIIWSDKPQAMLESASENKTLLVNIDDQVGKVKIKNIYKDRVVVGIDNQEWELR